MGKALMAKKEKMKKDGYGRTQLPFSFILKPRSGVPTWREGVITSSVNLRTETRVLFFEETCFFRMILCICY